MTGYLHSIETLGTVDGPGVRSVAFLSGCPLRCICCHNPDTWEMKAGQPIEAEALARRLARYRPYFGRDGGVTVSGGEPLMQAAFVAELFRQLKKEGIHTALDTSGYAADAEVVDRVLAVTDLVLLDLKYSTDAEYRRNVGCSLDLPLALLERCEALGIPLWVRRVIIPGYNDSRGDGDALIKQLAGMRSLKRVELLPFRKLCLAKYENMGIPFPLAEVEEPDAALIRLEQQRINSALGLSQ